MAGLDKNTYMDSASKGSHEANLEQLLDSTNSNESEVKEPKHENNVKDNNKNKVEADQNNHINVTKAATLPAKGFGRLET